MGLNNYGQLGRATLTENDVMADKIKEFDQIPLQKVTIFISHSSISSLIFLNRYRVEHFIMPH